MASLLPVLCVVAGPNGSGKTSTTVKLLSNKWASDSLYINPDNIAQQKYGDWNSKDSILKAAEEAMGLRYKCLETKSSFVFETVFSSQEKLDFLCRAHKEGFFIRFFYVCTESPEINILRITRRYLNGGHEVPISKVISRYYKSLSLASEAIKFVDRAYVYDNSRENVLPQILYRTYNGIVRKQYVSNIPQWAQALLM